MRNPAIPLLLMLAGCSCPEVGSPPVDEGQPAAFSMDPPVGTARQAVTEAYCTAACSAAAAVPLQKMYALCNYTSSESVYVSVGGYALDCYSAMAPACYGRALGVPWCVGSCQNGKKQASNETDETEDPSAEVR